ncbi:hypothetical protein [uncultured Kordia sp.]|uniref:hypothetical protein n=1 Tax=uncultured Kordia sp. TaxID=507699 RepID=UPI0026362D28|nr:hypothetical protein [uncultured Kordia sp.]
MKPLVKFSIVCVLLSVFPLVVFSQNDTIPKTKSNKLYFATHIFLGQGFTNGYKPEGALGVNIQFQGEERFGFGFDMSFISPESKGFTDNPPANLISNYSEGASEPFSTVNQNGAPYSDRFRAYSLYISKGFKPRDRVVIDFQAGFSLYQMKRSSYTYRYFPRINATSGFFGTSGGKAPYVLVNEIEGSTTFRVGAYFRINSIVRFRKRTVLSLSPFAHLNGEQSFYGIQLGISFGREYKLNILK